MEDLKNITAIAKETILIESNAIANLTNLINSDFENAVKFILNSKGRVVVTGIGKSANIATKIVATLNSTGTPAIFMHAADAIHGDLGIIQQDDVVICISKSGNTPEIKVLVPLIKNSENKIIAITGNADSFLGTNADFTLNTFVEKEACPNNLAPTTSTTAQLVMGDALAVCLLKMKGFTSNDFAKYHPGGALGKRLYLRVSDLIKNNEAPKVSSSASIAKVIVEISEKRLGVTAVLNDANSLVGIITDGDIRRMLSKTVDMNSITAEDIMGKSPKTISQDAMAVEALDTLENNNISQILVTDSENQYVGVVHLHDLIKEGILDGPGKGNVFLAHLEELRWHLVRSAAAIIIVGTAVFVFRKLVYSYFLLAHLKTEFATYQFFCKAFKWVGIDSDFCTVTFSNDLKSLGPTDQLMNAIWASVILGFIVSFPYILWEFWRFIAPGLSKKEVKKSRGFIVTSSFLFFVGVLFSYYVILPMSVYFFYSFSVAENVINEFTLSKYMSLITNTLIGVALMFELPVIIYFLSKLGLITPMFLKRYRKHALVVVLILSAIITPPDVASQVIVTIPILLLYEVSIIVSRRIYKKQQKNAI